MAGSDTSSTEPAFHSGGIVQLTWVRNYRDYGVFRGGGLPDHAGAYIERLTPGHPRTTRTSVHWTGNPEDDAVQILRTLAAAAGLVLAGACLADGVGTKEATLSKAETAALTRSTQAVIRQQIDLPSDSAASIAWAGPLRRDRPGEGGRVAAVAFMRFAGLTNRYCRVVVSAGDLARATLVPVPTTTNYDQCANAGPLRVVDLDGDGLVDLVHTVEVRSNRYPTAVSETVVYLGRCDAASGFCYSADRSRELSAADTRTAASLTNAAAIALKRTGKTAFICAKP